MLHLRILSYVINAAPTFCYHSPLLLWQETPPPLYVRSCLRELHVPLVNVVRGFVEVPIPEDDQQGTDFDSWVHYGIMNFEGLVEFNVV